LEKPIGYGNGSDLIVPALRPHVAKPLVGDRHLETDRKCPAFELRGCDRWGRQQGGTRFINSGCAGRHDSQSRVQGLNLF
jgi:hypothetical protein